MPRWHNLVLAGAYTETRKQDTAQAWNAGTEC